MNQDVIVIGLGAMGSATCYQLAKRGYKVTGLEQFALGHARGSSHGQSRIIRKAYFEHPDYVPLLIRAYELWKELSFEAGDELYHETGILYVCAEESRLFQGLFEAASLHAIDVKTLSESEADLFRSRFTIPAGYKAVLEPEAGFLEVENCVAAYLKLSRNLGATLVDQEVVITWSASDVGVEVVTNKNIYRAAKLVITAGAWSSEILSDVGLPLKILKKTMFWLSSSDEYTEQNESPCFLFEVPEGIFYGFPKSVSEPRGLKVAEHSGGFEIASPEQLNSKLEQQESAKIANFVRDFLPGSDGEVLSSEPCMYTMTPDENFILDLHPTHENVAFAAGFSGHGFKFVSVIGEILADLATQGSTKYPIEFLRRR